MQVANEAASSTDAVEESADVLGASQPPWERARFYAYGFGTMLRYARQCSDMI